MHAKYEVSTSNGSKVIVNVKVDNRQTNKQDKNNMPRSFRGHKNAVSAELNLIKRLQLPFPLCINDQIYHQGNMSSVRSNINIFSLKPDVHRKCRSHGGCRRSFEKKTQTKSLYDLLRIANNNCRHELLMHSLLFLYLD